MSQRPNVIVILADDMGFSDLGCYGGEIATPNLDRLARDGVRMSQFYNTARCSPSRASLLTGVHPHQTGIGILTDDDRPYGYPGTLDQGCPTMAEVLRSAGYATYLSGKWHLTGQLRQPDDTWPTRRGFDRFFGTIIGASDYYDPFSLYAGETPVTDLPDDFYYTNAISDAAVGFCTEHGLQRPDDPFFLYVAFTAPHWPLHAPAEAVAKYQGRYDEGWDVLRVERHRRLIEEGILDPRWTMSERDPEVPAWNDTPDQDWHARRMEVYAAQVEVMDAGIGRILDAVDALGRTDDTVVMFLSDNGGCAEDLLPAWVDELPGAPLYLRERTRDGRRVRRGNEPDRTPGGQDTFSSYGRPWANLSNTPFREYKHWVHEGGIATPFVVRWPSALEPQTIAHVPHQLPDIMATVLEITGVEHPADAPPVEGASMLDAWRGGDGPGHTLYFEHEGNAAVRRGRWKLVRKYPGEWQLYDVSADRTELDDRAAAEPAVVAELVAAYHEWAGRCGVVPRETILEGRGSRPQPSESGWRA
ncbi:arylsulfatase [Kribbella shirazensis]|uniref:Arylsulfatase n=1 Tax=Kribbella shirazensis TaxID=1105143 RepID=A0A7X6A1Q2_9ACTN|nr:arylsulfatase [Kribbella shirazensis]NIK58487.1 arylsulfatase [Kribbella shirazensis]